MNILRFPPQTTFFFFSILTTKVMSRHWGLLKDKDICLLLKPRYSCCYKIRAVTSWGFTELWRFLCWSESKKIQGVIIGIWTTTEHSIPCDFIEGTCCQQRSSIKAWLGRKEIICGLVPRGCWRVINELKVGTGFRTLIVSLKPFLENLGCLNWHQLWIPSVRKKWML